MKLNIDLSSHSNDRQTHAPQTDVERLLLVIQSEVVTTVFLTASGPTCARPCRLVLYLGTGSAAAFAPSPRASGKPQLLDV
jgi:hypothetical protein